MACYHHVSMFLTEIVFNELDIMQPINSIGGRRICNLMFAGYIDLANGNKEEPVELYNWLDKAATDVGRQIKMVKCKATTTKIRKLLQKLDGGGNAIVINDPCESPRQSNHTDSVFTRIYHRGTVYVSLTSKQNSSFH